MKNVQIYITIVALFHTLCMHAQMGYVGTNNYFLHKFIETGFHSYCWAFAPLKTDVERGGLKGNVLKVVTTLDDPWSFSDKTMSDTTSYNQQGNIVQVVAPSIYSDYDTQHQFRPTVWEYEYDARGKLKEYIMLEESANINGPRMGKHVHTMRKDSQGNITKEIYRAYSQEKTGWREFSGTDTVEWSFNYDSKGMPTTGFLRMPYAKLTYQNGLLTRLDDSNQFAVLTYDAQGRITGAKGYVYDEYDDYIWYVEHISTFTYNEQGDIVKAVLGAWRCTEDLMQKEQEQLSTFNIQYTYDSHGNWIKAVAVANNELANHVSYELKDFVITRSITYGEFPPSSLTLNASDDSSLTPNASEDSSLMETSPEFPGGDEALMAYLRKNMKYPKDAMANAIQGKVLVEFVVEKDGSISNVKVVRSVDVLLDKEAVRVTQNMPKWKPGTQNGEPVRVRMTYPLTFRLQ